MATGALIGGTVIGLIGSAKKKKAAGKSAKMQREAADKYYEGTVGAVERSREIEKQREAAELIADNALKEANEAFLELAKKQYRADQATGADWQAANAERRTLELENIALGAQERTEEIRRQERANEIQEGRANVRASASGFGAGSSLDMWVDTMVDTNEQDIQWWQEAGANRDALATADADLRFKMSEDERAAASRENLLGYEGAEAKFDMYESQREADAVMREADRAQRESDRQTSLDMAEADRYAAYSGAKTTKAQGNADFWSGIGGAVGGIGGISDSYNKYGWGW